MRKKPDTFRALIRLWKPIAGMAEAMGCPRKRVYKWHERDWIEPVHWDAVLAAVRAHHDFRLTMVDLQAMAVAARGPARETKVAA